MLPSILRAPPETCYPKSWWWAEGLISWVWTASRVESYILGLLSFRCWAAPCLAVLVLSELETFTLAIGQQDSLRV